MKIERPRFELTRVYANGTSETPEIIPVGCVPWDTRMKRRGFLGVGVGVAAVLLLVDGCRSKRHCDACAHDDNSDLKAAPFERLKAHLDGLSFLAITPDEKILSCGRGNDDYFQRIKLWSLPDGNLISKRAGSDIGAISPDGKTLAILSNDDHTIVLRSLPEDEFVSKLQGAGWVSAVGISPDGKILASGSYDHTTGYTVKLWALPEGQLIATLQGHADDVSAVGISPDGKILVSGSEDNTIKLWTLPAGQLIATLQGHADVVSAVGISPDGKILVSGSKDNTIKLWTLPGGQLIATLNRHESPVLSVAISPDGKILASGSSDHTVKVWALPDGQLKSTLECHGGDISQLAISPCGCTLVSGGTDGVVMLWDLEKLSFRTFLFDPEANTADAIAYNVHDKVTGQTITYTLPCGSPIPPGAVCTCNCVPGTYRPAPSGGSGVCTCDQVCTCIPVPSDREVKEAFETTDPLLILQKLSELPIQSWNYKWNNASIRHIGPMAQDFAAAFAVGEDDKHIHPVDAQGVAFAAIQGLYRMIKEKEARTESLQAQLREQQKGNEALQARIEVLERLVNDPLSKRG